MAVNKDTEILEFKVEQGSAIADLERTKKSIINLKKEQTDLNKAYKNGDITLEEYSSELVRVESVLKKQTSSYNTLQKSVAGVETSMDKLIKSNNKLADSTNNAVSNIRVAGVSVGDLTTKFAAFANPITATVGLVSALGAAYARSSIGAKDLEFAQNQLSFATTILTDKFAALFSSVEDGQGFFSKVVDNLISRIDISVGVMSSLAANAQEKLNEINERSGIIQAKVNERLAENSELLTDLSNTETDLNKKRELALQIQNNLSDNAKDRLSILDEEIEQQKLLAAATQDKGPLEGVINKLLAERAAIITQETKGREKIEKLLNAQVNAEQKRLEALRKQNIEEDARLGLQLLESKRKTAHEEYLIEQKKFENLKKEREKDLKSRQDLFQMSRKSIDDKVKKLEEDQIKRQEAIRESEALTMQYREEAFAQTSRLLGDLGQNQKALILAQLAFDTASAIGSLVRNSEKPESEAERAARYIAGFARIAANVGQAYRLIGSSSPVIGAGSLGTIITSSTGQQFVIQNGKTVSLEEAQKKAANQARRAETLGDLATGASIGAAVGSIVPGIGTAVGTILGAAAGGIVNAFKNIFGKGKAEGGYAGPGDKYEPKGFYHGGEVIWSKADVAAVGGPMIADSMRPTFKSFKSSGISMGSAKGGSISGGSIGEFAGSISMRPSMSSGFRMGSISDLISVVSAIPPNVLDHTEFSDFRKKIKQKEKYTRK